MTPGSKTKSIFHQTCKLSAFVLLREMACKTKHLTFYCSYCAVNTQNTVYYRPQRSCGKVMFSQASVILFTGGACIPACTGQTPPGQTPPPPCPVHSWIHTHPCQVHAGIHPRRPLQRTVRILLECILVRQCNYLYWDLTCQVGWKRMMLTYPNSFYHCY